MLRISIELEALVEPQPRSGRQLDPLGHGHGRIGHRGQVIAEQVERSGRRPGGIPGRVAVGVLGVVPGVPAAVEHMRMPCREAGRGVLEVIQVRGLRIAARRTGRGDPGTTRAGLSIHLGRLHGLLDGPAVGERDAVAADQVHAGLLQRIEQVVVVGGRGQQAGHRLVFDERDLGQPQTPDGVPVERAAIGHERGRLARHGAVDVDTAEVRRSRPSSARSGCGRDSRSGRGPGDRVRDPRASLRR